MNMEINRLAVLVEDFDRPFHPDEMVLRVYKKVREKFTLEHKISIILMFKLISILNRIKIDRFNKVCDEKMCINVCNNLTFPKLIN